MASLALHVRPPILTIVALASLTLVTPSRPHRCRCPAATKPNVVAGPVADVLAPPAFADAQAWPRGMVMGVPATPDRIAHDALTELLSGLVQALTSVRV